MRNSFLRYVLLVSILGLTLSCSKDYYDTKTVGEDFLAANAKNDSVVELPSGIQYKMIFDNPYGNYPQFTYASNLIVDVKYSVRFIDGSFYIEENTSPLSIYLGSTGTEKFWSIVVPKMRIGSKFKVWVPYSYAYAEAGFNKKDDGSYDIDPYTVLIYEIELVNAY